MALSAAMVLAAIGQEDISPLDEEEDLARGIISDVFDSTGDGSSTGSSSLRNELTAEPNQETNDNYQQ
ncbi:MAG: hypothetical protein ICV68_16615 [Pyrinomonadaceae bacterium]|nr:hypothetical protein [Pyrinomonadaceae bacterium]